MSIGTDRARLDQAKTAFKNWFTKRGVAVSSQAKIDELVTTLSNMAMTTVKTGTVSYNGIAAVITGLDNFKSIERIFIMSTEAKPSEEVVWAGSMNDLGLTNGATAAIYALVGDDNTYDGTDLDSGVANCAFENGTLTVSNVVIGSKTYTFGEMAYYIVGKE